MKPLHIFFSVIGIVWLTACAPAVNNTPRASNGILDLSQWDFARDGMVNLNGEWELYWQQLLTPQDFARANPPQPITYLTTPNPWTTARVNGQPLPRDGYATLRLVVQVKDVSAQYGVNVGLQRSAYTLWVNGDSVATSGIVGRTEAETTLAGLPQNVRFHTQAQRVEFILQLTSFRNVDGGPIKPLVLGLTEQTRAIYAQAFATELFLATVFFAVGIYELMLYSLRRKESAFLYFGWVCLLVAIWVLSSDELYVLGALWPAVSYELVQLLPRLTSLWIPPLLVAFFAALYPQESSLHVVRWSLLFALLYSPVLWLVPLPFMLETPTYLYLIGGLVMIGYASSVLLQATRARRPYARLLWLSFVPVTFTATLEILAQWGVVPFTHWTPWALLCGIGGQTLVLSHRFTQAFTAVEILAEHLNRTNQAYYRFVPREFLRLLGRNDITAIELGDQSQQEMTVLFADVRGFTSLSEQMTPRENFAFINTLMGGISPLIREHHGFIDKYIGDGIMALFPRCPEDALQAAVAMRQRLNTFNAARESQGHHPIRLGIGIHVGSLMLGTVGEPQRMDGTVIADVVNAASRLESLTKRYGVMLIVSEQVWRALDHAEQYSARRLGVVRAKGKRDPITLYEVFEGDATDGAQLKRQTRAEFETGLRHFKDGEFALAQQAFAQVLSAHPQDPAALYYHKQSEFYSTHAPPPDWDGIEVSTEK